MGCDIHVFVEVRYHEGCSWWGSGELLPLPRSYHRFAALAGVRGSGPAPRGLPADVSSEIAEARIDDAYAHSASWATLDEWAAVAGTDPEWCAVEAYARAQLGAGDLVAVRIVYWFDN